MPATTSKCQIDNIQYTRGVHGNGDDGIRWFPAGMGLNVAEIPQDGSGNCGIPTGMDFFGGDPAGMVEKFGCENFQSAYSIYTDQTNALTSIE